MKKEGSRIMQKEGRPHVALVSESVDLLNRAFALYIKQLYMEIDRGRSADAVDVSFEVKPEEYDALVALGNRLRQVMNEWEEYRWDFIMTMMYEDLFVGPDGEEVGRNGRNGE